MDWSDTTFWILLGLAGQAAFFSRFLVQWIASERMGKSVVPIAFWYLSLIGSATLFVYAIGRRTTTRKTHLIWALAIFRDASSTQDLKVASNMSWHINDNGTLTYQ